MLVLVVGDGLGNLTFQTVDCEVHLGDADGIAVLFLAVEDDLLRRVPALMPDEVAGLDEHASRTSRRIEDNAVVRLDDIDDCLHERRRREELAVIVGLLNGELSEEVFVDAAEDVAGGLADPLAVKQTHQVFEHLGFKDAIVLRQHPLKRLEFGLDGGHGLGDESRQINSARGRLLHDPIVMCLLGQPQRAPAKVVLRTNLALGHSARGLVPLNLPTGGLETVGGMTEEDHSQHWHEVVAGCELRVGAEVVRRFPEVGFKFFDVFEGLVGHSI